jgi:hypothetical protein
VTLPEQLCWIVDSSPARVALTVWRQVLQLVTAVPAVFRMPQTQVVSAVRQVERPLIQLQVFEQSPPGAGAGAGAGLDERQLVCIVDNSPARVALTVCRQVLQLVTEVPAAFKTRQKQAVSVSEQEERLGTQPQAVVVQSACRRSRWSFKSGRPASASVAREMTKTSKSVCRLAAPPEYVLRPSFPIPFAF